MSHPIVRCRKRNPEEAANLEEAVKNSSIILNEIDKCFEVELKKLEAAIDEAAFNNCDWAMKQAFKEGVKKGLTIAKSYVRLCEI